MSACSVTLRAGAPGASIGRGQPSQRFSLTTYRLSAVAYTTFPSATIVSGSPDPSDGAARSKVSRDTIEVPEYCAGRRTDAQSTRPYVVFPPVVTRYRGSQPSGPVRSTAVW